MQIFIEKCKKKNKTNRQTQDVAIVRGRELSFNNTWSTNLQANQSTNGPIDRWIKPNMPPLFQRQNPYNQLRSKSSTSNVGLIFPFQLKTEEIYLHDRSFPTSEVGGATPQGSEMHPLRQLSTTSWLAY